MGAEKVRAAGAGRLLDKAGETEDLPQGQTSRTGPESWLCGWAVVFISRDGE